MDEGYTINAVLSYAVGNTKDIAAVLDSGEPYECFLYCAPTAFLANHIGFAPLTFRILSVLFGFLTIVVIYAVSRKLFNRQIALLSAFFVTFSYFQIAWSQQARWYTMFSFFFWLAILCFIHFWNHWQQKKKQVRALLWYGLLTILTSLLTLMTQKIGILLPVLFLIYIVITTWHTSPKTFLRTGVMCTVALLIVLAIDTWFGQSFVLHFAQNIELTYTLPYYLSFLFRNYLVFIPFAIYALINNKQHTWSLGVIFLAYLVPLSFLTNIVHYRYIFHVTPVLFILASVGFIQLLEQLQWTGLKEKIGIALFVVLFFVSPTGVLIPQAQYFLESDDPATLSDRPSYAYTPQPDWNAAYIYMSSHRRMGDMIISSQPQFTKLYLREPGYWIKYNYLGLDDRAIYNKNDKEFYVGATIIDSLEELQQITTGKHGFLVMDYMAEAKMDPEIVAYIRQQYELAFSKTENSYSTVWVYRF
jgi:asparagine N-glycosylation enzyme membrane subunit Stt3